MEAPFNPLRRKALVEIDDGSHLHRRPFPRKEGRASPTRSLPQVFAWEPGPANEQHMEQFERTSLHLRPLTIGGRKLPTGFDGM